MEEARVVEEVDRFVVLSIKEDDKHNCELIGFTNIGEVNDIMLDKVERQCFNEDNLPFKVCTHTTIYGSSSVF